MERTVRAEASAVKESWGRITISTKAVCIGIRVAPFPTPRFANTIASEAGGKVLSGTRRSHPDSRKGSGGSRGRSLPRSGRSGTYLPRTHQRPAAPLPHQGRPGRPSHDRRFPLRPHARFHRLPQQLSRLLSSLTPAAPALPPSSVVSPGHDRSWTCSAASSTTPWFAFSASRA